MFMHFIDIRLHPCESRFASVRLKIKIYSHFSVGKYEILNKVKMGRSLVSRIAERKREEKETRIKVEGSDGPLKANRPFRLYYFIVKEEKGVRPVQRTKATQRAATVAFAYNAI